jgi:hypothetical protein
LFRGALSSRYGGGSDRTLAMNLLLLLLLALPFAGLAGVSLLAFLGVVALAAALGAIGSVRSALGFAGRADEDQWRVAGSDSHPLECVEAGRRI